MASWTDLTTTYTTNTLITVDTWNKLAGYSGNVQYLKDILDYFSDNEYVTYGFRTSSSFVNVASIIPNEIITTFSTIDTDEKTDSYPDEVSPQFFDTSNDSYRMIRRSGKYILTAHYNPTVAYNSGSGLNQSQTFDFTVNEKSISKTNFSGSNTFNTTSWMEASPTPVTNFYMGRLQEDDVLLPQILDASSLGDTAIATFSGSNTSFIDNQSTIVAKSPTVSTLFLNTPTLDVSPPNNIYSLIGGEKIYTDITTNDVNWEAYSNKSANLDPVFSNYYSTTREKTTYTTNSWISSFDSTYSLKYTQPNYVSGTTPKSIFSTWPLSTAPTLWPYYMIFALKSFDLFSSIPTNTEQNLFSIDLFDNTTGKYIGTPFQLTAYWRASGSEPGLSLIMRLYTNVTEVRFPDLTASTRMMFGLQVAQSINGFDIIWPKLILNNTEIAQISSWASNLTTYSWNYTDTSISNVINTSILGGVEFYSVKGLVANNAIYSGYYFIGDYKLSDTYLNDGITIEREKQYLWKYLPPLLSFSIPNYSFHVTSYNAGMYLNSWVFGTLIGLA